MSEERIIKVRKRKKASKGHVIRVSDLVLNYIDARRNNRRKLSCDSYLRLIMGLPDRAGEKAWLEAGRPVLLLEGYVDGFTTDKARTATFYKFAKDANGTMIMKLAKKEITKQFKPIKVREVR